MTHPRDEIRIAWRTGRTCEAIRLMHEADERDLIELANDDLASPRFREAAERVRDIRFPAPHRPDSGMLSRPRPGRLD